MTFSGSPLGAYTIFAVTTAQPLQDVDLCKVYMCLPIDLGPDLLPIDSTRYLSLVLVPTGTSSGDLTSLLSEYSLLSTKWLNVMTHRSWN